MISLVIDSDTLSKDSEAVNSVKELSKVLRYWQQYRWDY